MKPQFKIDFETFMISRQKRYPQYFEGQTYKNNQDLITISFIPIDVMRPTLSCEQHDVMIRFHVYSDNVLTCDTIINDLSALLSERTIDGMEFRTMETFQRGNKFDDVFESIANIRMYHWSTPDAQEEGIYPMSTTDDIVYLMTGIMTDVDGTRYIDDVGGSVYRFA